MEGTVAIATDTGYVRQWNRSRPQSEAISTMVPITTIKGFHGICFSSSPVNEVPHNSWKTQGHVLPEHIFQFVLLKEDITLKLLSDANQKVTVINDRPASNTLPPIFCKWLTGEISEWTHLNLVNFRVNIFKLYKNLYAGKNGAFIDWLLYVFEWSSNLWKVSWHLPWQNLSKIRGVEFWHFLKNKKFHP